MGLQGKRKRQKKRAARQKKMKRRLPHQRLQMMPLLQGKRKRQKKRAARRKKMKKRLPHLSGTLLGKALHLRQKRAAYWLALGSRARKRGWRILRRASVRPLAIRR